MRQPPWTDPAIIQWTQRLLDSYRHWIGRELCERVGEPDYQAHALFHLLSSSYPMDWRGSDVELREPESVRGVGVDLGQLVKTRRGLRPNGHRAEREWMLEQYDTRLSRYVIAGSAFLDRAALSRRQRHRVERTR